MDAPINPNSLHLWTFVKGVGGGRILSAPPLPWDICHNIYIHSNYDIITPITNDKVNSPINENHSHHSDHFDRLWGMPYWTCSTYTIEIVTHHVDLYQSYTTAGEVLRSRPHTRKSWLHGMVLLYGRSSLHTQAVLLLDSAPAAACFGILSYLR